MSNKFVLISRELNYVYKHTKINVKDLGNYYEATFIIYSRVQKVKENVLPKLKFRIKNIIDTYEPK